MTAAPVRVAICDDSRAFAEGLRRFLETDRGLKVVLVASCAEDLLGELPLVRPELITLDLELPGIDGVEAIRRIMATMPSRSSWSARTRTTAATGWPTRRSTPGRSSRSPRRSSASTAA
ncbi:MAG: response regulator [Solirubrobacteraceae bacterium]